MNDKLRREAEFWENFDMNSLQYGIPYWVDMQKAEYLNTPKRYVWCDPKIEAILYGSVKEKLFSAIATQNARILDVGCGAGWLSLEFARRGHYVTGIDIAEKRIEIARNTAAKEGISVNYMAVPIEELTVDKPFDIIITYGSLHHFPNVAMALEKINSLLTDDGHFLLVENSGNFMRDSVNWFRKAILNRHENSRSPYEDVSTKTLVAAVKSMFFIEKEAYDLAFTKILAETYDFVFPKIPVQYLYPLLNFSRCLDRLAATISFPKGEIVFIEARKK